MEFLQEAAQHLTFVVYHHPFYSAVASFILFCWLVYFYSRLTLGTCDSDQDMTDKTVLITGATAGIGKATAMDMARRNARVLLACRNVEKARKVAEEIKKATGNQSVIVKSLDLMSFSSVRECAKSVLETEKNLHVLINNAGIAGRKKHELTSDGCEVTMQSNHLGHFLLTLLLLDLLKNSSPSRIINVSSLFHKFSKLDVDDLNNKRGFRGNKVYGNTKMANVLFTRELAKRLQGTGVTVNSLHPGLVKTNIMDPVHSIFATITRVMLFFYGKTSEEGAQTTIALAVDPRLEKTTGKYFSDCREAPVAKAAEDESLAKRLFENSEKLVGESFCK